MNIICENVSKQYRNIHAIENINLKLETGINLLIGTNGAGKSTLLNILATVKAPTGGNVTYNKRTIFSKEYRSILGYLPQDFNAYENLTGYEFLMYMASIKGVNRQKSIADIYKYLDTFNLTQSANRKLSSYSGGMIQRIGIIQALINNPMILILDEPFNSLDPEERRVAKNILKDLSKDRIIILSSHVLQELEEFDGKIIVLEQGQVRAISTMDDLRKKYGNNFLEKFYFSILHNSAVIKG